MGQNNTSTQPTNEAPAAQPAKSRAELIDDLVDIPVDLWRISRVKRWLKVCDPDQNYSALVERYMLDGPGLLELNIDNLQELASGTNLTPDQVSGFSDCLAELREANARKNNRGRDIDPIDNPYEAYTEMPDPQHSPAECALFYHAVTMHTRTTNAKTADKQNWDSQPRPFRRYYGAPARPLHLPTPHTDCPTLTVCMSLTSTNSLVAVDSAKPTSVQPCLVANELFLSNLLKYSLAVSAKVLMPGTSWTKRVNPSSGGLHPVEAYVIGCRDNEWTVDHYIAEYHSLETVATLSESVGNALVCGLPTSTMFVVLTTIRERELWKYGERGGRYTLLDVGHALGSLRYGVGVASGCSSLDVHTTVVSGVSEPTLNTLVGVSGSVRSDCDGYETAVTLLALWQGPTDANTIAGVIRANVCEIESMLSEDGEAGCSAVSVCGKQSELCKSSLQCPVVDSMWDATTTATTTTATITTPTQPTTPATYGDRQTEHTEEGGESERECDVHMHSLATAVWTRRSAMDFVTGSGPLSKDIFVRLLHSVATHNPIYDVLSEHVPTIQLGVAVHSVAGVESGLYMLNRLNCDTFSTSTLTEREGTSTIIFDESVPFTCVRIPYTPSVHTPTADLAAAVRDSCCDQDIAVTAHFTVYMFACLNDAVGAGGPAGYRVAHYEAGLIGQALYVEATAAGVGATAMGCFVDDVAAELFGVRGGWGCLLALAVGAPGTDNRLEGVVGGVDDSSEEY